jgi:hypothetical protein
MQERVLFCLESLNVEENQIGEEVIDDREQTRILVEEVAFPACAMQCWKSIKEKCGQVGRINL